jgi:hypothetical protein
LIPRLRAEIVRSIAILGAAPLPVLQGRPPRLWRMLYPKQVRGPRTRLNEGQRLRLRVPVTPLIAAAHTWPFSCAPARIGCDASEITRPNHCARHHRTAAQPRAPPQTATTSLRGHLARVQSNRVSASVAFRRNSYISFVVCRCVGLSRAADAQRSRFRRDSGACLAMDLQPMLPARPAARAEHVGWRPQKSRPVHRRLPAGQDPI